MQRRIEHVISIFRFFFSFRSFRRLFYGRRLANCVHKVRQRKIWKCVYYVNARRCKRFGSWFWYLCLLCAVSVFLSFILCLSPVNSIPLNDWGIFSLVFLHVFVVSFSQLVIGCCELNDQTNSQNGALTKIRRLLKSVCHSFFLICFVFHELNIFDIWIELMDLTSDFPAIDWRDVILKGIRQKE